MIATGFLSESNQGIQLPAIFHPFWFFYVTALVGKHLASQPGISHFSNKSVTSLLSVKFASPGTECQVLELVVQEISRAHSSNRKIVRDHGPNINALGAADIHCGQVGVFDQPLHVRPQEYER